MEKTLKECLNEAANLIEQTGWIQNKFEAYQDSRYLAIGFCMIGAIRRVCYDSYETKGDEICNALGFTGYAEAFAYNDDNKRTAKSVIKRLRNAAAKLEN